MQQTSGMVTPGSGGGCAATAPGLDAPEGAAALHHPDQAQLEADKRSVYKHPLFPLLALLFERCEQATQSTEAPDSEGFNTDIQAFAHHHDRDTRPFLVDDPELDGLMIKAIQVLRIHLLELEKVQELCKDFCNRYITCLKGKMQSENLLRSDYSGYESNNNSQMDNNNSNSSVNSSNSNSPPVGGAYGSPHSMQVVNCVGTNPLLIEQPQAPQQQPTPTAPPHCLEPHQAPVPGLFGNVSSEMASAGSGGLLVHGSTPLGQIGVNPCPAAPSSDSVLLQGQLSPAPTTPGSMDEEEDVLAGRKKHKRGVLPKHATSVMRSWLFQHLVHPYPTEDEKRHIAGQTNLTLLQVNNWFINARRRILQPMLDASHGGPGSGGTASVGTPGATSTDEIIRSGPSKSSGKHSSGKSSKHRYWPDNIAHSAVHQSSSLDVARRSLSSDDSDNASSQESEDDLFDDEKPSSESDTGNQH